MFIGFETSGGGTYGFAFKASVLEGVSVNINRVESTIDYVNSLISSAALGENITETSNVKAIGGRTSTITQVPQPAVKPNPMPAPAVNQPVAAAAPMPLPPVNQPVVAANPMPVPAVNQPVAAQPTVPAQTVIQNNNINN